MLEPASEAALYWDLFQHKNDKCLKRAVLGLDFASLLATPTIDDQCQVEAIVRGDLELQTHICKCAETCCCDRSHDILEGSVDPKSRPFILAIECPAASHLKLEQQAA